MAEETKTEANFKHIVRIANVDVPGGKQIRFSLTKIKGIGINFADVACTIAGISRTAKTGNLAETDVAKLTDVITNPLNHGIPTWLCNRRKDYESGEDKHLLAGTLNFIQDNDLKRLKKTKTLRGMRHQKGLPVRGQRTKSNFRKSKGKVVGVKRKGAPAKK